MFHPVITAKVEWRKTASYHDYYCYYYYYYLAMQLACLATTAR